MLRALLFLCAAAAAIKADSSKCDRDPTTKVPNTILIKGGQGDCMGLYALSSKYHDTNKPVYAKMGANGKVDKYLYYMTSYRMWVVGKQLAKAPFDMAVESSADVPSEISRVWVVMSSAIGGGSKEMPTVKSVCAPITNRPTHSPTSNPTGAPSAVPTSRPTTAAPTLAPTKTKSAQVVGSVPAPTPGGSSQLTNGCSHVILYGLDPTGSTATSHAMGEYSLQVGHTYGERPVYLRETHSCKDCTSSSVKRFWLFYTSSYKMWVVSNTFGAAPFIFAVRSEAAVPTDVKSAWQMADSLSFSTNEAIRVKCPDPTPSPTFAPTKTPSAQPTARPSAEPTASPTKTPTPVPTAHPTLGPTAIPTSSPTAPPKVCARIVLKGQQHGQPAQSSMGAYVVQKDKLAGRPVFAMFSAHGVSYLYYTRGLWVVGPKLAGLVFKLAVTSPAKRPDLVHGEWSYFVQGSPQLAPKISAECVAQTAAPTQQSVKGPSMVPTAAPTRDLAKSSVVIGSVKLGGVTLKTFQSQQSMFCAGMAAAVGVPPHDVAVLSSKTHYYVTKISVHGKMVPDPNRAHWADMGVDIQFKILVTKAYAWDTAANSIVGIMEAPVFVSFFASKLNEHGFSVKDADIKLHTPKIQRPGSGTALAASSRSAMSFAGSPPSSAKQPGAADALKSTDAYFSQQQRRPAATSNGFWIKQNALVVAGICFMMLWVCVIISFLLNSKATKVEVENESEQTPLTAPARDEEPV